MHTHVHSSTIYNNQEVEANKMWCVRTVEYYSALKKKEILTQATMGKNPGEIMLSEISQSQKDKYCMRPFIGGP